MKVQNMTSSRGNTVPNQFVITDGDFEYFQSYKTIIAKRGFSPKDDQDHIQVWLDENKWDYSGTIGKYRNQFLGETKKETLAKIKSGEYQLVDLN